jgi:hypothetical protein
MRRYAGRSALLNGGIESDTAGRAPTGAGLSKLNSMPGRYCDPRTLARLVGDALVSPGSARPGSVDVLGPIARSA